MIRSLELTLIQHSHLKKLAELTVAMEPYLTPRGVDTRWTDSGLIPWNMTGFAPQSGLIFYSPACGLNELLSQGIVGLSNVEMLDRAVEAYLWCVHDYIHTWCYSLIDRAMPELGLGRALIDDGNLDSMVYCHLLSEVCAVVGLDYWYLSEINLPAQLGLSQRFRTLSTRYHSEHLPEFRVVDPTFCPKSKDFFFKILHLFCQSEILGADASNLRQSPTFYRWAKHELEYSVLQREYSRLWFTHLGGFSINPFKLSRPVDPTIEWRPSLAKMCADALWDGITNRTWNALPVQLKSSWSSQTTDFRFTNICELDFSFIRSQMLNGKVTGLQAQMLGYQYLCRYDWEFIDPEMRSKAANMARQGALPGLVSVLENCSIYKIKDKAPLTLFLLN